MRRLVRSPPLTSDAVFDPLTPSLICFGSHHFLFLQAPRLKSDPWIFFIFLGFSRLYATKDTAGDETRQFILFYYFFGELPSPWKPRMKRHLGSRSREDVPISLPFDPGSPKRKESMAGAWCVLGRWREGGRRVMGGWGGGTRRRRVLLPQTCTLNRLFFFPDKKKQKDKEALNPRFTFSRLLN